MFNFIQKLIYFIFGIQEKILNKTPLQNLKMVYSTKGSGKSFNSSATLELSTQANKTKVKLESNLKLILKKYGNEPQKLLNFIERSGTKVYKIKFADKILNIVGYEEGLISEATGLKALFLNLFIPLLAGESGTFTFKTQPMFVLRNLHLDQYSMIQQFYKWYAMKLDLPGFDAETQENFQKFILPTNDGKIKDLSVDEILNLKEAIARDVEAINFVVELAKSTDGSKNAMKKVIAGGASV